MNQDILQGKWLQLKGKAKEQWGKLTDDDWDTIAGKRDQLAGRLQERYGLAKDAAEKQIDEFLALQSTDDVTKTAGSGRL
jgi:uncharacterized protein YjbJ (UPF0337 family)